MDIGEKIKYVRETRKMKAVELAKATCLTGAYISDLENGVKTSPSIDVIKKIANALDIDPGYFISDKAFLPQQVMEVPDDLYEYMLDKEKLPYIRLAKVIDEQGISPATAEKLLQFLVDAMEKEKGE